MSEAPTRLAKQSTYQRTLSRRGSRRPISRSSMDTLYVNIYNDVSNWSDMLRGIGGSCTPDRNDRGTARLESASARTAGVERSEQGPVNLCLRTEDVKYLVSLLLNLGCEAKRRQSSPRPDAPPTEAIPLPLDAINVGQSDDDQPFLLLEVGIASLMFMVSPACLEQARSLCSIHYARLASSATLLRTA